MGRAEKLLRRFSASPNWEAIEKGGDIMDCVIRKATESDKVQIARAIAFSFEQDFSGLTNSAHLGTIKENRDLYNRN